MINLLLNRSREPIPTGGAETLVQGALAPLLPPILEIGSKKQVSTPREQQAKMADPLPPQMQMRSVSPPQKTIAAALVIDRGEDLYTGSLERTGRMDSKYERRTNKLGLSCAKLSSSCLQAYSASDLPNQLSWSWIELG